MVATRIQPDTAKLTVARQVPDPSSTDSFALEVAWLQCRCFCLLGPPVVPFYPFLVEGSLTKKDYRKKGTLILTSLLEDLARLPL